MFLLNLVDVELLRPLDSHLVTEQSGVEDSAAKMIQPWSFIVVILVRLFPHSCRLPA